MSAPWQLILSLLAHKTTNYAKKNARENFSIIIIIIIVWW